MITLSHVTKEYITKNQKIVGIEDVSLCVNSGEIFGIIGKSGAGKSTLLRCVNLLETPEKGDVEVGGKLLKQLPHSELLKVRRKISMIFQHFHLLSSKTVYENIAFPLKLDKQSNYRSKIFELLELVGLQDRANAYPSQLSGGQKQRVAIARALAADPHVLLCDEATSALDPHTTRSILNLLKTIRDQLNVTILLITHEMEVIKNVCDRVGVLEKGHLIEMKEVAELFVSPESQTAKELVLSTLHAKLPQEIEDALHIEKGKGKYPILRIFFFGKETKEPIIAQLIERFHLQINILQANIELIKSDTFGVMVVEIIGSEEDIERAKHFLQDKQLKFEIIGYIEKS